MVSDVLDVERVSRNSTQLAGDRARGRLDHVEAIAQTDGAGIEADRMIRAEAEHVALDVRPIMGFPDTVNVSPVPGRPL